MIFRRKCEHSSGTKHFTFNTEIDCADCLGKSTLEGIVEGEAEIEQAESEVAHCTDELFRRRGGDGQKDEPASDAETIHFVKKREQWTKELHRLIAAWPDRKAELMSEYNEHYGAFHKQYWKDKKERDEASKPDPGVPSVAWFAGDGDRDFFFEMKAHATLYSREEVVILEKTTGKTFV